MNKNRKWTDEAIASETMKIANRLTPVRMPTRSEIVEIVGNDELTNAIRRHGGYEYWAKRLGLEQKRSETTFGIEGERAISEILKEKGYDVKLTSTRHPYDLLVNNCVKIDVKTAKTSYIRGCPIHAYRLAKRDHTCDFYIFYEYDTSRIYVVPAHKCQGQVQVEMGNNSKLYAKYLGAFDLIEQVNEMYQRM